ncbi:hypothetical protein C8F04DRAFT_1181434 [Mycena alexandri]|uniref:Uncharacterized protein n=1 Tax=Mycena alexandri TaxID=1745969 RepID=A0AAD6SYJ4_9AGAR|nr:hypothetical protein C8F04DRAFT_1181434 [Mycena alexandri]
MTKPIGMQEHDGVVEGNLGLKAKNVWARVSGCGVGQIAAYEVESSVIGLCVLIEKTGVEFSHGFAHRLMRAHKWVLRAHNNGPLVLYSQNLPAVVIKRFKAVHGGHMAWKNAPNS